MGGKIVLYVAFAFFGVIAFLVTTSDAASRTGECAAVSTALVAGLDDVSARIEATKTDDPVKGVAALLEVAAAYDRVAFAVNAAKLSDGAVKSARGDLARALEQLHGWIVTYAQGVQKGETASLDGYRANVDKGRRDVDEQVKRIRGICAP